MNELSGNRYAVPLQNPFSPYFPDLNQGSSIIRLHATPLGIHARPRAPSKTPSSGHLSNVPAPSSQRFDYLGRDSSSDWDPYENKRLVDGVSQRELGSQT